MISKKTLGMVCKVLNSKLGVGTACSSVNRIKKTGSSQKDSKKGFTLVELIVVLSIIAILAGFGIVALLGMIDNAHEKEYISEAKAALTATETMMSDAYTDNVTFLSKEKRSQAKETAKAPEGTSFTIWTADSFAKADGTYNTMRSYSISEAMYKTEDGHYVYFDGTDWTVYAAKSDESGNDISEGKTIADAKKENKIYVWPLQAGNETIGKDTAGAIEVAKEDEIIPDTEKPKEEDVDTSNKDKVEEETGVGQSEIVEVLFSAGTGIEFSPVVTNASGIRVKYNYTQKKWVDKVNVSSFKGIDLKNYSCNPKAGFDSSRISWSLASGEKISDISDGKNTTIYNYIKAAKSAGKTATFTVSAKTQIVTIPITFRAMNDKTLDVNVEADGVADNKVFAQYGLGDNSVVYTSTQDYDPDNPGKTLSISKDILNVNGKKDQIEFYDDKHLDEDGMGRWVLNAITPGNYYEDNGLNYTNTDNISSMVQSYLRDYVETNSITSSNSTKLSELLDGGLTFEACADIYKKIYLQPKEVEDKKKVSFKYGELTGQEQIVVDVSQIEAVNDYENCIVTDMGQEEEAFIAVESFSDYSLFDDYGIEIEKNECNKLDYWYLQDCEYDGSPIGEAFTFGDEDWTKWHSRKWDCSEKILTNVFDEDNLTGELAEIDASKFKTLLNHKKESELQKTQNGWYDRSPVSVAFCELIGITPSNATDTSKSGDVRNIISVQYIKESEKNNNDYDSRFREICISTTKIENDGDYKLAYDEEEGKYIVDPAKIDSKNPAYTVAYSVKNTKTGKYTIYVFTEDDELDMCDTIPLYAQDSIKNLFRGFSGLGDNSISTFLKQLDTSNVDITVNMFKECSGFRTLDLSGLDLSNVTNSASMIEKCTNLQTVIMGNADLSNVTDFHQMFSGNAKLKNICTASDKTNDYEINIQNADILHSMFNGCTVLPKVTFTGDGLDSGKTCDIDSEARYKNGTNTPKKCEAVFSGCNGLTNVTFKDISFSKLKSVTPIYNVPSKTTLENVKFAN